MATNYYWLKKYFPIAQIVGIVMLAWALIPVNPYSYYILLRIIICGICIFLAVKAFEMKRHGWVWVLAISAVIYNPILRFHLARSIWFIVNLATIFLFIVTIIVLRTKTMKSNQSE